MVEQSLFRSDLYYRINVFPIELPPLRDRCEDIPLLVWYFARKCARRLNKQIETIRTEDMDSLVHYHWPGNIRELQNLIERSVILSSDAVLHPPPFAGPRREPSSPPREVRTLAEAERAQILQALAETDWVVGGTYGAAIRLGVKRTTLLDKMRRHGIFRPQV
jgi:formate hydrogenlyase transcriptional activator